MDEVRMSRRRCFRTLAAGVGAAAAFGLGKSAVAASGGTTAVEQGSTHRRRALRIGLLSDFHVQPEGVAPAGMAACLRHVQGLSDRPDLIINGGDCIMDSNDADDARTAEQWGVWHRALRDELSLPIEHCIGNHDVWGLNRARSRTTGSEPLYGKRRAMDALGLAHPYRSFDRAGWHFVFLDDTYAFNGGYAARIDEEQFEWLADDLSRTPKQTPIVITSHIPILSAAAFFGASGEKHGCYWIAAFEMHSDFRRLKDLFKRHPNVRLCLSGHLHLHDRVEYLGVTYLCAGAVSGNWWKGKFKDDCDPGYVLLDLFDDGSFEQQYTPYESQETVAKLQ